MAPAASTAAAALAWLMGQRPAYDRPTSPLGVRMPEDARRIYEFLAVTTGAPSVSAYVRHVLEQHAIGLGFELVPGVTAAIGPAPSLQDIAAWQAGEAAREPDRAVG